MLLSKGRVAYFGAPRSAESYFSSIGRPFPADQQRYPADAMLSLCCREDGRDLPSLFRRACHCSSFSSSSSSSPPATTTHNATATCCYYHDGDNDDDDDGSGILNSDVSVRGEPLQYSSRGQSKNHQGQLQQQDFLLVEEESKEAGMGVAAGMEVEQASAGALPLSSNPAGSDEAVEGTELVKVGRDNNPEQRRREQQVRIAGGRRGRERRAGTREGGDTTTSNLRHVDSSPYSPRRLQVVEPQYNRRLHAGGMVVAEGGRDASKSAPFFVQVEALSRRLLLRALRHPLLLVLHFGGAVAMSLCLASVFGGRLGFNLEGAQNRYILAELPLVKKVYLSCVAEGSTQPCDSSLPFFLSFRYTDLCP